MITGQAAEPGGTHAPGAEVTVRSLGRQRR
jgi:hypothetical protein